VILPESMPVLCKLLEGMPCPTPANPVWLQHPLSSYIFMSKRLVISNYVKEYYVEDDEAFIHDTINGVVHIDDGLGGKQNTQ
jgi:hypothetical protein